MTAMRSGFLVTSSRPMNAEEIGRPALTSVLQDTTRWRMIWEGVGGALALRHAPKNPSQALLGMALNALRTEPVAYRLGAARIFRAPPQQLVKAPENLVLQLQLLGASLRKAAETRRAERQTDVSLPPCHRLLTAHCACFKALSVSRGKHGLGGGAGPCSLRRGRHAEGQDPRQELRQQALPCREVVRFHKMIVYLYDNVHCSIEPVHSSSSTPVAHKRVPRMPISVPTTPAAQHSGRFL